MTEQAAAARRAYKRQWAKQNPDKVREMQRRYWEKKAAEAENASRSDTGQEGGKQH